jgi:hypothetical protein
MEALLDAPAAAGHGDKLLKGGPAGPAQTWKANSGVSPGARGMLRRASTQGAQLGSNPASSSMRAQS